jgi:hypothetical protein
MAHWRKLGLVLAAFTLTLGVPLKAAGPPLRLAASTEVLPLVEDHERPRPGRTRCSDTPRGGLKANTWGTWNADLTCTGMPESKCDSGSWGEREI